MFRIFTKKSFLVGLLSGILLAVIIKIYKPSTVPEPPRIFKSSYEKWLRNTKITRRSVPFDSLRYANRSYVLESKYLHDEIKVLCVVLVKNPKNADAIQNTWGRHCNNLQSINLVTEKRKIPAIKKKNDDSSWVLLCKFLKQVPEEFQWVLVVYDNTFVLVENLRLFVASLKPEEEFYLGHAVRFWSTVYNLGQAGYVLSKGAVDSFKQKFQGEGSCTKILTYRNQEDFYLGKNLASLNITPIDTRDEKGLSVFQPYNLYNVFYRKENDQKFSVYPHRCCSSHMVAFQSIEGDKMYTYYYLLYTLQLFHYGQFGNKPPFQPFGDDEVWKSFLKERDISENISAEQYYKIWENIVDDPTSFARHMKREEYFDYL